MSLVWINGVLAEKTEARVSPFDHGFLYGDGVWEPMRVFHGQVFLATEHLEILWRSASDLNLEIPLSRIELRSAIELTLNANLRTEGYVRVIVTRGVGTIGPDSRKLDPQVIVIAEQYHPFPQELREFGLHASVFPEPVDTDSKFIALRTLGQPHIPLAKRHALAQGCLEAILVSRGGQLVGTTEGKLYLVKSGHLVAGTHQPSDATANFVESLSGKQGLKVIKQPIQAEDLDAADEAFLAGTSAGVFAIIRVNHRDIGAGREGTLTKSLREAYAKATTKSES